MEEPNKLRWAIIDASAGAISGGISRTVRSPLLRFDSRPVLSLHLASWASLPKQLHVLSKYTGIVQASKDIFREEGIKDPKAFSSFIMGILSSSHHESLKAQKAINEVRLVVIVGGGNAGGGGGVVHRPQFGVISETKEAFVNMETLFLPLPPSQLLALKIANVTPLSLSLLFCTAACVISIRILLRSESLGELHLILVAIL
ncbi:hypothetical protein K1719_002261 [Acacia pycnantha]|nr:hypothetical protein K1719_002261 [Acacia pycnantha]